MAARQRSLDRWRRSNAALPIQARANSAGFFVAADKRGSTAGGEGNTVAAGNEISCKPRSTFTVRRTEHIAMSETPKSLTRSLGMPFWIGYAVSFAVLFIFLAAMHVLDDGLVFWLFFCVALGVFAPAGGLFFQAIHDLVLAKRQHQIQILDLLLLVAIIVSFGAAIYFALHTPGKSHAVWIAGAFVYALIWIYARKRCA